MNRVKEQCDRVTRACIIDEYFGSIKDLLDMEVKVEYEKYMVFKPVAPYIRARTTPTYYCFRLWCKGYMSKDEGWELYINLDNGIRQAINELHRYLKDIQDSVISTTQEIKKSWEILPNGKVRIK